MKKNAGISTKKNARVSMKKDADVSIALTSSQLAQVLRQTSRGGEGVISLLPTLSDLGSAAEVINGQADSGKLSRSVLRALLVLAAFPQNGTYRPLIAVSKELGYNPSTTHRYASTWLAIGLLEQDPSSRKYRRPIASLGR
jgi:hypothetical protein